MIELRKIAIALSIAEITVIKGARGARQLRHGMLFKLLKGAVVIGVDPYLHEGRGDIVNMGIVNPELKARPPGGLIRADRICGETWLACPGQGGRTAWRGLILIGANIGIASGMAVTVIGKRAITCIVDGIR